MIKVIVTEKKCAICKNVKKSEEFGEDKKHSDGLSSYCHTCDAVRVAEWRKNNPQKSKEINARYIKSHKEQRNAESLEWNKRNKERARNTAKIYRQNNLEKIKENIKKWRVENHDKNSAIKQNYRARKYAGGTIKNCDWLQMLEKYGHRCLKCGRSDVPMTLDHVLPLALGGLNIIENAQPLCFSCNSAKGAKHIDYR